MRLARWLIVLVSACTLMSGCSLLSGRNLADISCQFPDDPLTLAPNWVCEPQQVGVSHAAVGSIAVANQPPLQAQQAARDAAIAQLARQLQSNVAQQIGIYPDSNEAFLLASQVLADTPVLGSRRSPQDQLYVVVGLSHQAWLDAGARLLTQHWSFWQVPLARRNAVLDNWLEFSLN